MSVKCRILRAEIVVHARAYLALEALSAFTPRAALYWAVVRATLAVDVLMGAVTLSVPMCVDNCEFRLT